MTRSILSRAIILGMLAAASALAGPITWDVDFALDDGATVTGSFVLNPDAGLQDITTFNIDISAATIPNLIEPGEGGVPTSVFPTYDFTPSNSTADGPYSSAGGAIDFFSDSVTYGSEHLVFQFVPLLPLTDTSDTNLTNSDVNVNSGYSVECYNCDPYVCFVGATDSICSNGSPSSSPLPEPGGFAVSGLLVCALAAGITIARRRERLGRPSPCIPGLGG